MHVKGLQAFTCNECEKICTQIYIAIKICIFLVLRIRIRIRIVLLDTDCIRSEGFSFSRKYVFRINRRNFRFCEDFRENRRIIPLFPITQRNFGENNYYMFWKNCSYFKLPCAVSLVFNIFSRKQIIYENLWENNKFRKNVLNKFQVGPISHVDAMYSFLIKKLTEKSTFVHFC
jgi:hypothetical protein